MTVSLFKIKINLLGYINFNLTILLAVLDNKTVIVATLCYRKSSKLKATVTFTLPVITDLPLIKD